MADLSATRPMADEGEPNPDNDNVTNVRPNVVRVENARSDGSGAAGKVVRSNVDVKRKARRPHVRGGPINRELHYFCKSFLRTGEVPSSRKLKALISTTDIQKSQIPSVFGNRFVTWASKMKLNKEGQLIVKETGKIIPPRENYRHLVTEIHKKHCRFHGRVMAMPRCHNRTISVLGKKYAVGHRNFGLSRKEIRKIICSLHGSEAMTYDSTTKTEPSSVATRDEKTMDTDTESSESERDDNRERKVDGLTQPQELQVILVDDVGKQRKAYFSPEEKHMMDTENVEPSHNPKLAAKSNTPTAKSSLGDPNKSKEPVVNKTKPQACKTLTLENVHTPGQISNNTTETVLTGKKLSSWGKVSQIKSAKEDGCDMDTTDNLHGYSDEHPDHIPHTRAPNKLTNITYVHAHVRAENTKISSVSSSTNELELQTMTKDQEERQHEHSHIYNSRADALPSLPSDKPVNILTDYNVDSDPGRVCPESPWIFPGMLEEYPSILPKEYNILPSEEKKLISYDNTAEETFGGIYQKFMEDLQILAHDIRQCYCLGRRQPLDRVRRGISIAQARLQQCRTKLYQTMNQPGKPALE